MNKVAWTNHCTAIYYTSNVALTVIGATFIMNDCNHLEWKCVYTLVQPQNRLLYEMLLYVALFVGLALLLAIFNGQSSIQTLSVTNQIGLKGIGAKITESDVSSNNSSEIIKEKLKTITADPFNVTVSKNSKLTERIKIKEQPTTATTDKSTPSGAAVSESYVKSININDLKLKSIDVKELIANLKGPLSKALSTPQIEEIASIFRLPSLNYSVELQHQFLDCSGINLLRWSVKGGILHMPKHFQTCKNMTFQKARGFVALLSWPGSGNSWIRQLLETTTGIYTGAWYCDPNYIKAGMLGEGVKSNNVLVMKIHFPDHGWLPEKVMYVVRNPFDCILAEWNRILQEYSHPVIQHTITTSRESFVNNKRWDETVKQYATSWSHHIRTWLGTVKVPTVVIQYERLSTNLYTELRKMLDFLGVSYTESDIQCTIKSTTETFHRKHDKNFDPYTPEQRRLILREIQAVGKILHKYNIIYGN
ncbi:uncharacterized protein [Dysidea avara]|uniref:uncharacterized protein isoform X2 n=1 Tax=Dysidea avara TaxID=196820 RepID=UPI00331EB436